MYRGQGGGWWWGKGNSPPACSPDFQPWPYCLSYLHLFKSTTSTHTRAHSHAHTSVSPGNLSFYSPRPSVCPQEPPTRDLPLSGPRRQTGATEVGTGWGREKGTGPTTTHHLRSMVEFL